jgi:hypothetical protein
MANAYSANLTGISLQNGHITKKKRKHYFAASQKVMGVNNCFIGAQQRQ